MIKTASLTMQSLCAAYFADTWTCDTVDSSVLCIGRYYGGDKIIGLFNFSEDDKSGRCSLQYAAHAFKAGTKDDI